MDVRRSSSFAIIQIEIESDAAPAPLQAQGSWADAPLRTLTLRPRPNRRGAPRGCPRQANRTKHGPISIFGKDSRPRGWER